MVNEYTDFEEEDGYVPQSPSYMQPPAAVEASVMKMSDPEKVLEKLKMELLGYEWDNVKDKWVLVSNALMNKHGVHSLMVDLRPFISTLATLSSMEAEEVEEYAKAKMETIVIKIASCGDAWNLSVLNYNTVADLCFAVIMTLRRGVAGKEKRFISNVYDEKMIGRGQGFQPGFDQMGGGQQPQSKGMLGLLNPFKSKK